MSIVTELRWYSFYALSPSETFVHDGTADVVLRSARKGDRDVLPSLLKGSPPTGNNGTCARAVFCTFLFFHYIPWDRGSTLSVDKLVENTRSLGSASRQVNAVFRLAKNHSKRALTRAPRPKGP